MSLRHCCPFLFPNGIPYGLIQFLKMSKCTTILHIQNLFELQMCYFCDFYCFSFLFFTKQPFTITQNFDCKLRTFVIFSFCVWAIEKMFLQYKIIKITVVTIEEKETILITSMKWWRLEKTHSNLWNSYAIVEHRKQKTNNNENKNIKCERRKLFMPPFILLFFQESSWKICVTNMCVWCHGIFMKTCFTFCDCNYCAFDLVFDSVLLSILYFSLT